MLCDALIFGMQEHLSVFETVPGFFFLPLGHKEIHLLLLFFGIIPFHFLHAEI